MTGVHKDVAAVVLAREIPGRVDVGHGRLPKQVHALAREQRAVARRRSRVAREVLARPELERVDEDAHHDTVGRAPGEADERHVPVVERAHRRHERHGLAAAAEPRDRAPELDERPRAGHARPCAGRAASRH